MGFPGGLDGKESACNEGDLGSIPGSGISPGEGNNNPVHYSYLENSMDREAWWATVHGVAKESHVTEATKHTQKFTQKGLFNFHSYGAIRNVVKCLYHMER